MYMTSNAKLALPLPRQNLLQNPFNLFEFIFTAHPTSRIISRQNQFLVWIELFL